jgi:hypothetical protein
MLFHALAILVFLLHLMAICIIGVGIGSTLTWGRLVRGAKFRILFLTVAVLTFLSNLYLGFCPLTLAEQLFLKKGAGHSYQGTFFARYFPWAADLITKQFFAFLGLIIVAEISRGIWQLIRRHQSQVSRLSRR